MSKARKVTNDPTGQQSVCLHCGATIEEALFLKNMRVQTVDAHGRPAIAYSPGTAIWRTLDRGNGAAKCPEDVQGAHHPDPARIRRVSAR